MSMKGSPCPPATVFRIHALAVRMEWPRYRRLALIAGAQTRLLM